MNKNVLVFSLTVIAAGAIIAAAILFHDKQKNTPVSPAEQETQYMISPVTTDDHILGNPNADIVFVEYADVRCPFCREFHVTMERIIAEYGKTGDVAWVYRHFPREDAIQEGKNSLSMKAAVATECAATIGGEETFWDFISALYTDVPPTFEEADIENIAMNLDLDMERFKACMANNPYKEKINQHITDGLAIYKHDPSFGTPYTIVITKSGDQLEITGSQSYLYLKEIIKQYSTVSSNLEVTEQENNDAATSTPAAGANETQINQN